MNQYKLKIDEEALYDIQEATNWYNEQSAGLGVRFQKQVKLQINSLKKNPKLYSNRYADVRCMLIKNFPYRVHYTVNVELYIVEIFAVFHTSRNPKIWDERLL